MLGFANQFIDLPMRLDPLLMVDVLQVLMAPAFKLNTGFCCLVQVNLIIVNSNDVYEHVLEVMRRNEP
jgi:hypothetical protein